MKQGGLDHRILYRFDLLMKKRVLQNATKDVVTKSEEVKENAVAQNDV